MNVCIPVKTNDGLSSEVFGHFGSAPYFAIYDTESRSIKFIKNNNADHAHGTCQPLKALGQCNIGAVVCVGMGTRAVERLNEEGVKAYKVSGETAGEIIEKFQKNILEEITVENACSHHNCD